jgi:hypothetical protein
VIPYEREEISCRDDDAALATFRTFLIFAHVHGTKEEIRREEAEPAPYPCTVSYEDYHQQNGNILSIKHYKVSTYTRSIGTKLEQRAFMGQNCYDQKYEGIWGKIVGGTVGLLLGGPGGAMMGVAAGDIIIDG